MTREQKIARAKTLRSKGWTYRAIGKRLGVTAGCIQKWLNRAVPYRQQPRASAPRFPEQVAA